MEQIKPVRGKGRQQPGRVGSGHWKYLQDSSPKETNSKRAAIVQGQALVLGDSAGDIPCIFPVPAAHPPRLLTVCFQFLDFQTTA